MAAKTFTVRINKKESSRQVRTFAGVIDIREAFISGMVYLVLSESSSAILSIADDEVMFVVEDKE